MSVLLETRDVEVTFPIKGRRDWPWTPPRGLRAVAGVSLQLAEGETLGIVGESGSGKSTLARAIVGTIPATAGQVLWQGRDLAELGPQARRAHAKDVQMVFQDPLAALNPRMTVGQIIAEPLRTHSPDLSKAEMRARVQELMTRVGLLPNLLNRYPHEFSGGQCQRIGIARALILRPKLLICDEPVSALDVSVQAQVINLLAEIQKEFHLSIIFIAHDLSVVRHVSDRIAVMYLGRLVEEGPGRDADPRSLAPLYQGADRQRAGARPGGRARPQPGGGARRTALADGPALGLCVPHPLPGGAAVLCRACAGIAPGDDAGRRIAASPAPTRPRISRSATTRAEAAATV